MLTDYEQELTLAGGHRLNFAAGTEYGSRPYDLKLPGAGTHRPEVGEPIHVMYQATADLSTFTSLAVALVASTSTAGTGSAVVLVNSGAIALATINPSTGVYPVLHAGIIAPGAAWIATHRYMVAKLTIAGSTGDGYVKVWLMKGTDVTRANTASVI